jgi:ATP-dependent exoDNAse (exonuclease V) beta subunit
MFKTPGYDAAKDAEGALNDAELIRMVYVAATRAKDHLVVSLCRGEDKNKAKESAFLADSFERFQSKTHVVDRVDIPAAETEIDAKAARGPADSAGEVAQENAWIDHREAVLASFGGLRMTTATGLAHLPDTSEDPAAPTAEVAALRRGRGGTSLGRAVHAVLQVIDLANLTGVNELAAAHAAAEGIGGRGQEVVTLVRSAADSPVVRQAVSGRFWREVPVAGVVQGALVEGYIDLVYEDDGGLGIIDYKTDSVSERQAHERMHQYEIQGETYRMLLEEITGLPVTHVTFVFAALGGFEANVWANAVLKERVLGALGTLRS